MMINLLIAGPIPLCPCGKPSVYLAMEPEPHWVCEKHKDEYFAAMS